MRLLHLIHTPRHSGAEILVCDLCRLHRDWGHDCAVAAFSPAQPEFLETAADLERQGTALFFPGRPKVKWARTAYFGEAVRRFRPDVVFAHSVLPSLYGRFATGVARRVRFVSVLHSATTDDFTLPSFWLAEWLTRFRVDRVVTVADIATRNYAGWFGNAVPIATIGNGIDATRFSGVDRQAARRRLGLEPGRRVILQVGRLCEDKQQHVVLAASRPILASGDGAELWFAGLTEAPDYERRLRRMAFEGGIEGATRFLGSRSDIPELLAAADVFVMPSRFESQGIAMLEALASGIPAVVSDIPAFAFASALPSVQICSPSDESAWTAAIARAFIEPRAERDLSRFAIEDTARSYIELAMKIQK